MFALISIPIRHLRVGITQLKSNEAIVLVKNLNEAIVLVKNLNEAIVLVKIKPGEAIVLAKNNTNESIICAC